MAILDLHIEKIKKFSISINRRIVINLLGKSSFRNKIYGEYLCKIFGLAYLSTKELFRDELQNSTDLGRQILSHYQESTKYKYVPDEIVFGMVARRLLLEDCRRGVILDGFPRTELQSEVLLNIFLRPGDFYLPIFLKDQIDSKRFVPRFFCKKCEMRFKKTEKLKVFKHCPACNIPLHICEEEPDQDEIKQKENIFNSNIAKVVDSINKKSKIHIVNAMKTDEDVIDSIREIIELELSKARTDL